VDSARGERKIDRSSADKVAFARIGASFVKIDIVSASPQVRGEQSTGETLPIRTNFGTDKESMNQESRKAGSRKKRH